MKGNIGTTIKKNDTTVETGVVIPSGYRHEICELSLVYVAQAASEALARHTATRIRIVGLQLRGGSLSALWNHL